METPMTLPSLLHEAVMPEAQLRYARCASGAKVFGEMFVLHFELETKGERARIIFSCICNNTVSSFGIPSTLTIGIVHPIDHNVSMIPCPVNEKQRIPMRDNLLSGHLFWYTFRNFKKDWHSK